MKNTKAMKITKWMKIYLKYSTKEFVFLLFDIGFTFNIFLENYTDRETLHHTHSKKICEKKCVIFILLDQITRNLTFSKIKNNINIQLLLRNYCLKKKRKKN